ncbi:MAG: insulinase family protein, partial [Cryomorphaceae bacterium]
MKIPKFSIVATLLFGAGILSLSKVSAQNEMPENFYFDKLDNGLELLVIEDPSVPLVTIEIAVHNGAYTESPEFDGLSHLYEHMFFKANKNIPSQEKFLERVSELGISFNGTTSDERVNYYCTLSSTKLNEGLEFMNNAIRYPLFLEEEMKKENPVVDGEFQRAESSPVFFLM